MKKLGHLRNDLFIFVHFCCYDFFYFWHMGATTVQMGTGATTVRI